MFKRYLALAVLALLTLAPPALAAPREARVTLTSANLHRALTPMPAVTFGTLERSVRTITVSDATRYQRITGFGASMTDSSAWLLNGLTTATRDRVVAALAKVVNYERIPMGASDFIVGQPYTYSDGPGQFSIAHDEGYILPMLKLERTDNPSTLYIATPWTAPPWMKSNDAYDNTNWTGNLVAYQPYADYFLDFIRAYDGAGIPIGAVSPINEGGTPSEYPGLTLNEPQFITQNLIPTLRAGGLATKVYDLDGSGFSGELQWLSNSSYRSQIAGTAVHCYAGLKQLSAIHAANPAGDIMETECSPGIVKYAPAEMVIASLRNWASTAMLWNLALDPRGGPKENVPGCSPCYGLATVDGQRARLNINYYELAQASLFIKRGAVRIDSTRFVRDYASNTGVDYGVTPGLDNVAAENPDGSKALLAYNNSDHPIRFQVAWRGRGFRYVLRAHSTVTFVWR